MILSVVPVHCGAACQARGKDSACRIVTAETWGVTILMLLAKM